MQKNQLSIVAIFGRALSSVLPFARRSPFPIEQKICPFLLWGLANRTSTKWIFRPPPPPPVCILLLFCDPLPPRMWTSYMETPCADERTERVGLGRRRRDAEISLAFLFPDDASGSTGAVAEGRMSTETTSSRRNGFSSKMKTQGTTLITTHDEYELIS